MADATGTTVSVRLGRHRTTRRRRRLPSSPPAAPRSPSPATARSTSSRPTTASRRRRARGAAAAARPSATVVPRRVADAERPHHLAAGPLHRGVARQAARGAGHRPAVDVGVDHPDRPGPRLRVEEGPGAGADVDGVRRRRPAGAALRRARRLRVHRPDRGRPRRHRPQRAQKQGAGCSDFYFGDDAERPARA